MDVIHFTQGATDPLTGVDSSGARFLPLADGTDAGAIVLIVEADDLQATRLTLQFPR